MNAPVGTGTSPFGSLQSMDGIEEVLASLSHSARLGGAVLLVAGAISVGYTAGGAIKGKEQAQRAIFKPFSSTRYRGS